MLIFVESWWKVSCCLHLLTNILETNEPFLLGNSFRNSTTLPPLSGLCTDTFRQKILNNGHKIFLKIKLKYQHFCGIDSHTRWSKSTFFSGPTLHNTVILFFSRNYSVTIIVASLKNNCLHFACPRVAPFSRCFQQFWVENRHFQKENPTGIAPSLLIYFIVRSTRLDFFFFLLHQLIFPSW